MRGNRGLRVDGLWHVGNEQASCTIHFGPSDAVKNQWPMTHYSRNQVPPFSDGFHLYRMVWTETQIIFYIDNVHLATIDAGTGFWNMGGFQSSGLPNPWAGGTVMAPFDQEFFIIMNLAVGGTSYFEDGWVNDGHPKPW